MRCERCRGPMTSERVFYQGRIFPMLRCLLCGNLVDWLIVMNRRDSARVKEALKTRSEEAFQEEIRRSVCA